MRTDWNNKDIERLKRLIDEKGRIDGIKHFSKESGRTENSIRVKLWRINKEQIIVDAENEAYKELEENKKTLNWFSKIVNGIHRILL